jgi:hypothetical protein
MTPDLFYPPSTPVDDPIKHIFPFLSLPKELRLQIYSYLSTSTHEPISGFSPRRFGYWPVGYHHPSLLVCKLIYAETLSYTRQPPAAMIIRPTQQQKCRALQAALQRGYAIDLAENKDDGGLFVALRAVDAAVEVLSEKVPFGAYPRNRPTPRRIRALRYFFAQMLLRLRRYPVLQLEVIVRSRPYKHFNSWYGSPTAERALIWYTRDAAEVWLLCCGLLHAEKAGGSGAARFETKTVVRGEDGDRAFERVQRLLEDGSFAGVDIVCDTLGETGYRGLPNTLGSREGGETYYPPGSLAFQAALEQEIFIWSVTEGRNRVS